MKKIISFGLILVILGGIALSAGNTVFGKTNVFYQSGALFNYQEKQILLAPNSKDIELIEITEDDKLIKINEFKGFGQPIKALIQEKNKKTSALVLTGEQILEYDITDIEKVKLTKKFGNNWQYSDYYYDIAVYGNNKFLTAGKNGIALWDGNTANYLEKIYDKETYGVSGFKKAIYAVSEEGAILFNAQRDKFVDKYMRVGQQRHQLFVDEEGLGFFPGDDVIKLRTFSSYKNLEHPSGAGNAVDGLPKSKFVYFVNGWGVYKLDKSLNIIARYNASNNPGEWTSGVNVSNLKQGARITVFNGKNILLLDEDLNLLDEYHYVESYNTGLEERHFKISPAGAKPGHPVLITGKGFWPGETVDFQFGDKIQQLIANNNGIIFKVTEVPNMIAETIAILLKGILSKYSHGFHFRIDSI